MAFYPFIDEFLHLIFRFPIQQSHACNFGTRYRLHSDKCFTAFQVYLLETAYLDLPCACFLLVLPFSPYKNFLWQECQCTSLVTEQLLFQYIYLKYSFTYHIADFCTLLYRTTRACFNIVQVMTTFRISLTCMDRCGSFSIYWLHKPL